MHLFALDPWWSDFYAVGGFAIGVLSLLVGLIGFGYTLRQVWKVQAAADAAKEAAKKTLEENRASFERFVGDHAFRLVNELDGAVISKNWHIARLRVFDLAELFATLRDPDNTTNLIVVELREFAQVFAEKGVRNNAPFDRLKFRMLINNLCHRLDRLRAPFPEERHGYGESNSPA